MTRRATAVCALLVALAGPAAAHEPERAQARLAEVARRHAAAREPTAGAETLYALGEAVEALVELLNEDVGTHGRANFFTEALAARLQAYGITVTLLPRTGRYAYDLAAFEAYLRRAPQGPHAADAAFRVLDRNFHRALGEDLTALGHGDVQALLRAIAAEERFLRDHPQHPRAARVRFFLAVDYVRAARHVADPARAAALAGRARQTLVRVARESRDPFETRAAETLLERLPPPGR